MLAAFWAKDACFDIFSYYAQVSNTDAEAMNTIGTKPSVLWNLNNSDIIYQLQIYKLSNGGIDQE